MAKNGTIKKPTATIRNWPGTKCAVSNCSGAITAVSGERRLAQAASLSRLCDLATEAHIYRECLGYYPFVLGAQPVRPIDLAAFYAAIANEGLRPTPYVVESIERNGEAVFRHRPSSAAINSVDRAAFYQLKTMLQGVVARGTARSIASLSPYVAGKTGTSDDENDAWFIGFTNDVTVAIWIGYDNADGKHRTLGSGATGGGVAVPIFEQVIQAVWATVAAKAALGPPSAEAKRHLTCESVELDSEDSRKRHGRALSECLRIDAKGKVRDTQHVLLSPESADAKWNGEPDSRRNKRDGEGSSSRNSRRAGPSYDGHPSHAQWGSRWENGQQWRYEQQWRIPHW
jgi:penicillin-binding protein 1A